jgi:hypothetical protein
MRNFSPSFLCSFQTWVCTALSLPFLSGILYPHEVENNSVHWQCWTEKCSTDWNYMTQKYLEVGCVVSSVCFVFHQSLCCNTFMQEQLLLTLRGQATDFLSFIIWFMILVNEASIQTGIWHSNTDKAVSVTWTWTREVIYKSDYNLCVNYGVLDSEVSTLVGC